MVGRMPHHSHMNRWLDRRRNSRMNRWLDRRRPWQFALFCWASVMAGPLLGTAITGAWDLNLGLLIVVFFVSIVVAVIALWSRQRREDANTVADWVESRRPPLP